MCAFSILKEADTMSCLRVLLRLIKPMTNSEREKIYPVCRTVLGEPAWTKLSQELAGMPSPSSFSSALARIVGEFVPEFLPDLSLLEETCFAVIQNKGLIPLEIGQTCANPTLQVLELAWTNLIGFLDSGKNHSDLHPIRASERVLIWYDPHTDQLIARPATDEYLLVLKMVFEGITPEDVARQGSLPIGVIDQALSRAVASGLILEPPSRIRREHAFFGGSNGLPEEYLSSPSFTLQWHITQDCDLSCKHCYDRSRRAAIDSDQAVQILDDFRRFCRNRHVAGAVSFTGGNPLLHPAFMQIYRAAAERGFTTAILGNPTSRERIKELINIQMPAFFQVSLEGLKEHNDDIRGPGHFDRVLLFLDLLRELKTPSMVMLTLTSANIDQVLPLADILHNKADVFHFNRLSMVGEGANLKLPEKEKFRSFLGSYLDEAGKNPIMGLKDNAFNILLHDRGLMPFGGCTGYGCGAAFNFVTLLADGEVHACRKFPSPIGNILKQTLANIYDSEQARRYRAGSASCRSCAIHPVCGGCFASAYSHNLNIFEDRDPYCFVNNQ